jgi:hypothetical protein
LPGDLTLMAGSEVQVKIQATKEIARAALRLVGPDVERPLAVNSTNRTELTGSFTVPAEGLTGFSVLMVDTQNMATRDPAVYRVEILPDQKPGVRITSPERKEELVTREAVLPVGMRIEDDHAVVRVVLHYKVDTVGDGEARQVELDLQGATPVSLQNQYRWNLGSYTPLLTEGSMIEFWITAQDNNNVTGPGVGESEHHLARVVSVDEKRAELLNRAGDYLGGLDDVAEDQEKANQNLGTIIRATIMDQASPAP